MRGLIDIIDKEANARTRIDVSKITKKIRYL
jgi:hypothetical protein